MIRSLEPWFENISKRQVKAPKIYFRDSGILHTLLGIDTEVQLYNNPRVGASWEGFALEETIRCTGATLSECFFWSTYSGAELDLFIIKNGKRIGFEFIYTDNPRVTKSIGIAINDLKLDHVYIIAPKENQYQLDEKVTIWPLGLLSNLDLNA